MAPAYAELQVTSNFSFLRGASHAQELALAAHALGLTAFAIADRNSMAGVVRGHTAVKALAKEHGAAPQFIPGCRLDLSDGLSLLAWPTDRAAYGRLSRLLSQGRMHAPKGECHLQLADVAALAAGIRFALVPPEAARLDETVLAPQLAAAREALGRGLLLAASHRMDGEDARRLTLLQRLAQRFGLGLLATNDVHYHAPDRRRLQDVLTCIRLGTTIDEAGLALFANAERHIKAPLEMARLFADLPQALHRTLEVAEQCRFSLSELTYEYPDEILTPGETAQQALERLTAQGAAEHWPQGVPDKVAKAIAKELVLIGEMNYAPYFLTVQDIVREARARGILCQGRGSAANSAVCYCLGVTSVDPANFDLLFERFISKERGEPPDIDVDFEHERREEIIQYLYAKYGRDRAGLAAAVTCYRARGALRDVGKAMGLSLDTVGRLTKGLWGWGETSVEAARLAEIGLDPGDSRLVLAVELTKQLIGFPRHLSQHVGGFIIARGLLTELCPVIGAAMADRTTIEWDKDDIDALGILKVDVLALGMLTCIRRCFDLIGAHYRRRLTLANLPQEDAATYDMLCRADSLGVFQVESRAQMNMLPRLRPRTFYDLVVEVAIVRPGPIQGDMVHPYIRRRQGLETVSYPSDELKAVLQKTLGVPLFQEQAMSIAIVAAGFTPDEADRLRRAMATFRHNGDIHKFEEKMVGGMIARGYDPAFAQACFKQIEGFGTYGFPESHAASFALLVYVSSWLKCHYPDVFAAGLLNSQPMGFYAPAQIVRDALEHGVVVRPVDVNASDWDCTLEPLEGAELVAAEQEGRSCARHALRLGLRMVEGLHEEEMRRMVAARGRHGGFTTVAEPMDVGGVSARGLELLARADACAGLGLDRRAALWQARALGEAPLPLFAGLADRGISEADPVLPQLALGDHVAEDYAHLRLSLKAHPMALLRAEADEMDAVPMDEIRQARDRRRLRTLGLVLVRQRPGTARGIIFITLEDETGTVNCVLLPELFEANRRDVLTARLMMVEGRIQRAGDIVHLRIERLRDCSSMLHRLTAAGDTPVDTVPDGRNFR